MTTQIINNNNITIINTPHNSLPLTILKNTGSAALYIASSTVARKTIFTAAMYLAGGSIISTMGVAPVIMTGAIIWLS